MNLHLFLDSKKEFEELSLTQKEEAHLICHRVPGYVNWWIVKNRYDGILGEASYKYIIELNERLKNETSK